MDFQDDSALMIRKIGKDEKLGRTNEIEEYDWYEKL